MLTLRLKQHPIDASKQYPIDLRLEGEGLMPLQPSAHVDFTLTEQEQEELRWYLEDYLQYPLDPAPTIAKRIEAHMADIGMQLFKDVFQSNDDVRDLWATLRTRLNETRIEIITDIHEATSIPWELLRDHKTDAPLALRAQSFVRSQPNPVQSPSIPHAVAGEKIRILLVICRPSGRTDVPFRSVASHIIKGLSEEARDLFELDVLRPPTFEQLGETLRAAKAEGKPYHAVHFDGHGAFIDVQQLFEGWTEDTERELMKALEQIGLVINSNRFSPDVIYPQTPRKGNRGYLVFENPQSIHNLRLVDGTELGKLLVETNTPMLVLNACRSAHAESLSSPDTTVETSDLKVDPHSQVRAFGTFAQEVMDQGTAGVVAMRYNVYVVTAAQFVAQLYGALAQGQSLGEAVTYGRKQLHDKPWRTIAYDPIPLQDWPVPIVYEAAPINLFPLQTTDVKIDLLTLGQQVQDGLPQRPDVGFYGRDETLLALDRAFDTQSIVLLHAFAGSGKTTTAVEFARWYKQTGGLEGPVLFTSFENYKPLLRVLDDLGRVFEQLLEANKIQWLALNDAQRAQVAVLVMKQIPVLWIWDNVEPIAGFPTGTPSTWSTAEQLELVDFLRAARETQGKFLLTSRRDEHAWLEELPARLTLPPMPMQERVQLAHALADKYNVKFNTVQDWRPLLQFTQGNPLTITVVVGQALREHLTTKDQIIAFVSKLRSGETAFEDEQDQGRSRSLGASLSYGFEKSFSEDERKILALLHFFQGFVVVDALRTMGAPEAPWCLPELRGLTRDTGITLLDRAAEVGLLTAHGDGYYSIHPALPWYFKSLFDQYYSNKPSTPTESDQPSAISHSLSATRAFVETMGELGNYYHNQYGNGNRDVITVLGREEDNLLYARRLARANGWWRALISTMQGLRSLYDHTGRRAEWRALVNEIVPDFVDPAIDGPRPEREDQWSLITEYRVRLAREARQWSEAERLQRAQVEWCRHRATPALNLPVDQLDVAGQNIIRTLAASLHELGEIQREQSKTECVASYEESATLTHRIGDQPAEAVAAINLGNAYKDIPALRDLDQAERWYRRSLELHVESDRFGRSNCYNQLGMVAHERFNEARAAKRSIEEQLRHVSSAVELYKQTLNLTPPNAIDALAVTHNQLGSIYGDAGDLDRAIHHYRESIRYKENAGNIYGAATTRFNVALVLANAGRFDDALSYAQAALHNYQTFGDRAAEKIQETQGLVAQIEELKNRNE